MRAIVILVYVFMLFNLTSIWAIRAIVSLFILLDLYGYLKVFMVCVPELFAKWLFFKKKSHLDI
jgi:hypothetical protein